MTQQKPVSVSADEVSVSEAAVQAVSAGGGRASADNPAARGAGKAAAKPAAKAANRPAAKAAAQLPAKLVSSNGSGPTPVLAQVPTQAPVIPLPTKTVAGASGVGQTPVSKPSFLSKYGFILSLFLCVLLPGILGSFYFIAVASDRFAAGAGFSVRSMDSAPTGGDLLGAISGLTSVGSTTTDSYIIVKYLESEKLVKQLIKEADFLKAYSGDHVDFLYRLDPSKPIEDIIDYWSWMIEISYDTASEIIEFEVQAFTAPDAEKIALLITRYAQELINRLSSDARNDAVRFAKREVASAELRLKFAREKLREYRSKNRSIDPVATAAASVQITTTLESQIIAQRARLNTLRQSLSEGSSSIKETKILLASLEKELTAKRSEISKSSEDQNLAALLSGFERLQVEQEFAQQAYVVTLSSLERARAEADRQQRFLAVFKHPSQPSSAIYPHRVLNSILTFVLAFIFWSIGLFMFYSIRDHLR